VKPAPGTPDFGYPLGVHGQELPSNGMPSEQSVLAVTDAFPEAIVRRLEDEAARGGKGQGDALRSSDTHERR